MRVDVYNTFLNSQKIGEKLTDEEQRLVDKMILDGKRAGLALPEDKRDELMKLKKELAVVCTDFGRGTQRFAVWNVNVKSKADFLGCSYLDLFPRESKYSHAVVWPLQPGLDDGSGRHYPTAPMVANLAKPTPGQRPRFMMMSLRPATKWVGYEKLGRRILLIMFRRPCFPQACEQNPV
ncbi:hypothetical protein B0J17DRAFT_125667 [Rhizoctonia solani]|nr:hypothetical protein B0J17DRAFT_125667 [Rhizoctonia solani]